MPLLQQRAGEGRAAACTPGRGSGRADPASCVLARRCGVRCYGVLSCRRHAHSFRFLALSGIGAVEGLSPRRYARAKLTAPVGGQPRAD